jgi:hypothetical protein
MNAKISPLFVTGHVESTDTVSEIERFIEEQMRHQCARFLLAQRGETFHPLNDWLVEEMVDARSLAMKIHGEALREANEVRESSVYGVFAFHANSTVPVGRTLFRIEVESSGLAATNKPDDKGVIAMLMGHADSFARLSLGNSRETVEQYHALLAKEHEQSTRMLDRANARIRVLEEREVEFLELREKFQMHVLEQSLVLEEQRGINESRKRSDDRKDDMRKFAMERLAPLLPFVVAKLTGGANPANETAGASAAGAGSAPVAAATAGNIGDQLVDGLVETMTPDQAKEIASLLTPQQQVLFIQLYEMSLGRLQQKYGAAQGGSAPAAEAPAASPSSPRPSPTEAAASAPPDPNPQAPSTDTASAV